ncbi:hypothetical protein EFM26_07685, partial [Limosilactobacillus fermentum]|nr:hypothetical protein [Limosilactobacillus fermentum]
TKVYNAGELAFIFLLKKPITTRLWRDYQLSSFSYLMCQLDRVQYPYVPSKFFVIRLSIENSVIKLTKTSKKSGNESTVPFNVKEDRQVPALFYS